MCIESRASAVALALDLTVTAVIIYHYQDHEAIRTFQEKQKNYNKFRNVTISLRNCIINAVDDK